jgi:ERCC4-type nuclease
MITAILIDSREPSWIQQLDFGAPSTVTALGYGDLQLLTQDECVITIERKTPDDFLNTLSGDRLFPQLAPLAEISIAGRLNGKASQWVYLVITGTFGQGPNRKVVTDRGVTGWDYGAVQGALASVQEMGVTVVHCAGDLDYKDCVIRLANRNRDQTTKILAPKPPLPVGMTADLLISLPGIGLERYMEMLRWSDGNVAHALCGITDLEIDCPLGKKTRQKIRQTLGLRDNETIQLWVNNGGDETLHVVERKGEI